MGEQSKSKVHAPYNFVPFSEKVLLRYAGPEELPRHDQIDPALKSGDIHVTMTADTPVFVSDGRDNFFRGPNGQYALPGSTIRGMVRENMQILGFGCVHPGEDFEDVQIYFREMAAARGSAGGALKAYYQAALGVETRKVDRGRSVSVPTKVRAGYLRSTGRGYVIQPVRGTYLRVSRKHPDAAALGLDPAQAVPVAYRAAGDRVTALRRGGDPVPGMERGMLLVTGRPVGRPNHLYLFPQADEDKPAVELSDQDVLSYQEDWENRKNVLGRANFWALPRAGEEKPVFYLRHEGHTYFGMSLFLRIGYGSALSQGLPQRHRDAQAEPGVDYPHGILGFAGPEGAYRSRVSFGDLPALGQVKPEPPLGAVLAGPKPSYYPGYLRYEPVSAHRLWQRPVPGPAPAAPGRPGRAGGGLSPRDIGLCGAGGGLSLKGVFRRSSRPGPGEAGAAPGGGAGGTQAQLLPRLCGGGEKLCPGGLPPAGL